MGTWLQENSQDEKFDGDMPLEVARNLRKEEPPRISTKGGCNAMLDIQDVEKFHTRHVLN